MARLKGGRITLKIDGKAYDLGGDFKYGIGADKREEIVGPSGVVGYSNAPTAPYISGEIIKGAEIRAADIAAINDSTVTLDLADGTTFVLYNAWSANDNGLEVETKQGKITVKFIGIKCKEILAT